MRLLKRFASLPHADQSLLLRVTFVVAAARIALWLLPFALVHRIARSTNKASTAAYSPEKLVWAVAAVGRRLPWSSCLTQALAAQALLARSGHSSRVEIGVAKGEPRGFEAHAWLIVRERIVLGGPAVDRYTPLIAWETTP